MNPAEVYILKQEEPYRSIMLQLQAIIEAVVPEVELLFKWGCPFFYANGIPICFLNQSKDYVDFAFWHREKLTEYNELFVTTNRTLVTSFRFRSPKNIEDDAVVYILQKQLEINTNPFTLVRKKRS